jgi:putative sterol carrier protein
MTDSDVPPSDKTPEPPEAQNLASEEPQVLAVETEPLPRKSADRLGSSAGVGEGEEDDNTWTNLPSSADDLEQEESEEIGADEGDDDTPVVTKKAIQCARDVICEELPVRADRAKLRLRPQLTGAFVIEVSNTGERFLFDWRGSDPKVTPVTGPVEIATAEQSDPSKVDCIISISDQNMMAVRSGDLNPQVAMLADKIKVQGKMGPAVYLFNLVAPRVRDV